MARLLACVHVHPAAPWVLLILICTQVWDVRMPQRELAVLFGHGYAVRRVLFSPHAETLIASCSYDMTGAGRGALRHGHVAAAWCCGPLPGHPTLLLRLAACPC